MTRRSRTIDIARSLAILGVVLGHAIFGLRGAGLYTEDALPMALQEAWSIGRMPAMFFLVGLFIPRAVERREHDGRSYMRERLVLLLWVYLVWQTIQAALEVLGSRFKNVPVPPSALYEVWSPLAHLWFLPTLALGTAVVFLARPWARLWTPHAILVTCTEPISCSPVSPSSPPRRASWHSSGSQVSLRPSRHDTPAGWMRSGDRHWRSTARLEPQVPVGLNIVDAVRPHRGQSASLAHGRRPPALRWSPFLSPAEPPLPTAPTVWSDHVHHLCRPRAGWHRRRHRRR